MTEPDTPKPRVLVYGSCVARDTLEFADPKSFELGRYVARQSLISVGSDATRHLPAELPVNSKFQDRMIRNDFAGTLLERLADRAAGAEVLLWDLADERHGVHRFPDGTIATRSIDTIRMPEVAERFDAAEHIPFGSAEHFRLWRQAVDEFDRFLREHRLFDRTVVLQVPWAVRTTDGKPSPWSMGVRASDANRRYLPYYDVLRRRGHRMVELDERAVLADPEHRWGLAPFHYTPEVYREVLRQLHDVHGMQGLSAAAG